MSDFALPTISAGSDWSETWRNIAAGAATLFSSKELIQSLGGENQYMLDRNGNPYIQGQAANGVYQTGLGGITGGSSAWLLLAAAGLVLFLVLKD